jgi:taurine dioxygenase
MSSTAFLEKTYHHIAVKPYTPAIGAWVDGIDLGGNLSEGIHHELRQALNQYGVLFLRNQEIEPAVFARFARVFGEPEHHNIYLPTLEGHPEVELLENSQKRETRADFWHSDVSWRKDPPLATVLYSKVLPEVGGDTVWASTAAAYDRLPEKLRDYLSTLQAVHSFEVSYIRDYLLGTHKGYVADTGDEKLAAARAKFPPVVHPVVKTHPETGRKVLYVSPLFTSHLLGIGKEQGNLLLNQIYEGFKEPEVQARLRWEKNTVVIWDNRQTVHYGVKDYGQQDRVLHRITLKHDGKF